MAGEEKRSRRELQVRDDLWEAFGRMAGETGFSRDALINEAMKQFARSRGYGSAPKPVPTHDDYSGPHAMEPTSSRPGRTRPPPLPSDPAPKRLYLHFNGQRYFVDPTEDFIIGRARTGCHLTIKDPNISRRHAAIAYRNGSYYLQDLGSVNGIDFHGESVDHKRIENGDSFKLCEYELVFSFQDA